MSTPILPTSTRGTSAHWPALGTTASVLVTDAETLGDARKVVCGELDAIDRACSRFRADSELERVNRRAPRAVAVSELLIEAVEVGLRAVHASDGDVDPALGEALLLAGYDRDFELLELARDTDEGRYESPASHAASPGAAERRHLRIRARRVAGWRTIEVDRERSTIRVGSGVRLDLGATAKALAADRSARAVHEATGTGVLVNLGGDLAVAGPAPAGGWPVFVTDDHRNSLEQPGQLVQIAVGGLATSSVTRRRWLHEGSVRHHVIDPHTQLPARSCWRTASVAAATCVDANIASTAALVRGLPALAWLAETGLPARLVTHSGVVLTVGAWPREQPARAGEPCALEEQAP